MAQEYPVATLRGKKKNGRIEFRVGQGIPPLSGPLNLEGQPEEIRVSLYVLVHGYLHARRFYVLRLSTEKTAKSSWELRNVSTLVAPKNRGSVTPKCAVGPRQPKKTGEPS